MINKLLNGVIIPIGVHDDNITWVYHGWIADNYNNELTGFIHKHDLFYVG